MTDRILIKDLLLRTIVGINPEERRNKQDVLINITLYADTRPAGNSDNIDDAVNYRTITKRIIKLVEASRFHLVEKMAAEIVAICLDDERVQQATVRVEKPGALRFARSVGVEIDRSRADVVSKTSRQVFISLGSNIDPEKNLPEAVQWLSKYVRVVAASPVYETRALGPDGEAVEQPNFFNAAVLVETALEAERLKTKVLKVIEAEMGRVRSDDKYAARPIDLDISLYGEEVIDLGGRRLPDPEILWTAHIARPLADLAPDYVHPETGQTLAEIAQGLPQDDLEPRPDVVLTVDL